MILIRRITKIAAQILILLLIINPLCITVANAGTIITNNSTKIVNKSLGQAAIDNSSEDNKKLTDKEKEVQFTNKMFNYYWQNGKASGPEWLKTTDLQLRLTDNNKLIYSFETIHPLTKLGENGQLWFWQGRYAHESGNSSTANIGFGWRKLSADKNSIVGINTFYDYGFKYNLARVGLGVEYFNKLAEYRTNWYHPLSGDRITGVDYQSNGILYSYIRAVEGLDFEAGTSLTHMPWLKLFAGGYYWDNKYSPDEKGYRLRSMMQLTPKVNMELGYTHSNLSHSFYGNIKYQVALGASQSKEGSKEEKDNSSDIGYKLLQKVERENDIKTEAFKKFVAYTGSIKATVTNSNNNTPISGVTVKVLSGTTVITSGTTDSSGVVILGGIAAGTYTVSAFLSGYSINTASVTVMDGMTTGSTITLTADTFTITASAGTGGSISPSGATGVSYGATPAYTITPNTGYVIADVKVDGVSVGTGSTYTFPSVTGNHTITATFALQSFTITASAGTGGSISPSGATGVSYSATPAYTITPNTGYVIVDVKVDGVSVGTGSTYTFPSVTGNHTITATFALQSFTITASAGTGGSISPSGATSVSYGATPAYTITLNTGYVIADIKVDGVSVGTGSTYTFPSVTGNHTITATFALQSFTITASAGTGGSISPSGATGVSYGATPAYTITPNTGYVIADVKVDGVSVGTGSTYTFPSVTGNHTITATFAKVYTISITNNIHGRVKIIDNTAMQLLYDGSDGTINMTVPEGHVLSIDMYSPDQVIFYGPINSNLTFNY
ncbi:inverse autotransporter beta domain-containing protein [Sporomusa sp. GT1]|uniref:inverse autotransporter beta domain-containing protein n=1 Tax=Sporomusa sp. GT1 TaxID=1534747 RepID=UPI00166658C0|nr:inverse autotransporter beta domain-containing protein [Sporomusa sp. GT1]